MNLPFGCVNLPQFQGPEPKDRGRRRPTAPTAACPIASTRPRRRSGRRGSGALLRFRSGDCQSWRRMTRRSVFAIGSCLLVALGGRLKPRAEADVARRARSGRASDGRRGAAFLAASKRNCRSGCRRSCAWPPSRPWRRPTATSRALRARLQCPLCRAAPPHAFGEASGSVLDYTIYAR